MKLNKRVLPSRHFEQSIRISGSQEALPFYVRKTGFCNHRRFSIGDAHDHTDFLLLYAYSSMEFSKYGSRYPISLDDVVFTSCNAPVRFSQRRKNDYLYLVISGKSAQLFYNHIRNHNYILHTNPLSPVLDLFLAILDLDFEKDSASANLEAGVLIHQLLFELYKHSRSVLETKKLTPVQDTAVNAAIRFIQQHYADELTIDTVCNSVSFSKYYFCKLFREHTGMTVHQYVNQYRIHKSRELLSYSKLSIAAVANSVGFKNSLTFTRQFKEQLKMTPSEYRELY